MPIYSDKRLARTHAMRHKALELRNEGYSYQEIADILEVEQGFKRTKQWAHHAVLWAKNKQNEALSTDKA